MARLVLEAATEDRLLDLTARYEPASALWGQEASRETMRTARPRSSSTRGTVARTAANMLQMRPASTQLPGREGASPWPEELDAWSARYVAMRSGAIPILPASIRWKAISLSATGAEVGALAAAVTHALPGASFLLTEEQRDSCGCKAARGVKTSKEAIPPALTHKFLFTEAATAARRLSRLTHEKHAALAMAAVCGWPVGMTRTLKVQEVRIVFDKLANRHAVVFGYEERPEGGVKIRRTFATSGAHETKWSAGSSPAVAEILVPWLRVARDAGWTHLFPSPTPGKIDGEPLRGDIAIGARALEALCPLVKPGTTWHGHRVGVARALEYVHLLDSSPEDGPSPKAKIPQRTVNALQMRSNLRELGSHFVYTADAAEDLLEATRSLHRVDFHLLGGLMARQGGPVGHSTDDYDFETECQKCGTPIPYGAPGHLCDAQGCEYALCPRCHPNAKDGLTCPHHKNTKIPTPQPGTEPPAKKRRQK